MKSLQYRARIGRPLSAVLLFLVAGCSLGPSIYNVPGEQIEQARAGLRMVGVSVSDQVGPKKTLVPARGTLGGFARGLATGAAFPVAVGFVAPIPGGTALGLLVAPFTAVAGGLYGAAKAPPTAALKQADAEIDLALTRIKEAGLRDALLTQLVRLGQERTKLRFIPHQGGLVPSTEPDVLLEARLSTYGLRGIYGLDPKTSFFLEMEARLIQADEQEPLLQETIVCSSQRSQRYIEWARNGGEAVTEEVAACIPELAEKIVDDLFLFYPTAHR